MRTIILSALGLGLAAALSACSSDSPSGSSSDESTPSAVEPSPSTSNATSSAATSASPSGTSSTTTPVEAVLKVRIKGNKVLPNAQEISIKVGEGMPISITSDRAGELHVHSVPEQYVEFKKGTTQTVLKIKTPGSVEIEDHKTSDVVALVEVR